MVAPAPLLSACCCHAHHHLAAVRPHPFVPHRLPRSALPWNRCLVEGNFPSPQPCSVAHTFALRTATQACSCLSWPRPISCLDPPYPPTPLATLPPRPRQLPPMVSPPPSPLVRFLNLVLHFIFLVEGSSLLLKTCTMIFNLVNYFCKCDLNPLICTLG